MARKLAIVVSSDPALGDLHVAINVAQAARDARVEVSIFFMAQAVSGLLAVRERLAALSVDGCDLICCASSADACQLSISELEGVLLGSQDDHAAMVTRADRVLAFT